MAGPWGLDNRFRRDQGLFSCFQQWRKRGEILVRVFVKDVASGITINGAAVAGASGWRAGSTETEALMNEALQGTVSFKAVHDIEGRRLPTSTVLTTLGEKTQIDKGARVRHESRRAVIVYTWPRPGCDRQDHQHGRCTS